MLDPKTVAAIVYVASQPIHCILMVKVLTVRSYAMIVFSGFVYRRQTLASRQ